MDDMLRRRNAVCVHTADYRRRVGLEQVSREPHIGRVLREPWVEVDLVVLVRSRTPFAYSLPSSDSNRQGRVAILSANKCSFFVAGAIVVDRGQTDPATVRARDGVLKFVTPHCPESSLATAPSTHETSSRQLSSSPLCPTAAALPSRCKHQYRQRPSVLNALLEPHTGGVLSYHSISATKSQAGFPVLSSKALIGRKAPAESQPPRHTRGPQQTRHDQRALRSRLWR